MIDIKFKEKIQKLKDRFMGEDVDASAIAQIKQWEDEISRLSIVSDFVNQPIVQEIVKLLKDRRKSMLIERATKGNSDILQAREKEIMYVLELLLPKYASELETLESIIDKELL